MDNATAVWAESLKERAKSRRPTVETVLETERVHRVRRDEVPILAGIHSVLVVEGKLISVDREASCRIEVQFSDALCWGDGCLHEPEMRWGDDRPV